MAERRLRGEAILIFSARITRYPDTDDLPPAERRANFGFWCRTLAIAANSAFRRSLNPRRFLP
jgi:hypothetical protein